MTTFTVEITVTDSEGFVHNAATVQTDGTVKDAFLVFQALVHAGESITDSDERYQ